MIEFIFLSLLIILINAILFPLFSIKKNHDQENNNSNPNSNTGTSSCIVQNSQKKSNDLKKIFKKFYQNIFNINSNQPFTIHLNEFQGWCASCFIIKTKERKFFVKYWDNLIIQTPNELRFSYEVLKYVNINQNGKNLMKAPKVYMNKDDETITVIKKGGIIQVVVVMDNIKGDLVKENLIEEKFEDRICTFLDTLYSSTKEIIRVCEKKKIKPTKVDFCSEKKQKSVKKQIEWCEKMIDKLKIKHNCFREKRTLIMDYLMMFYDFIKNIEDEKTNLVITHSDFHGNNILIDSNEVLWVVDWDFCCQSHLENDFTYYIDERYMDLTNDPLNRIVKLFVEKYPKYGFGRKLFDSCYYFRVIEELIIVLKWRNKRDINGEKYDNFDYQFSVVIREIQSHLNNINKQ